MLTLSIVLLLVAGLVLLLLPRLAPRQKKLPGALPLLAAICLGLALLLGFTSLLLGEPTPPEELEAIRLSRLHWSVPLARLRDKIGPDGRVRVIVAAGPGGAPASQPDLPADAIDVITAPAQGIDSAFLKQAAQGVRGLLINAPFAFGQEDEPESLQPLACPAILMDACGVHPDLLTDKNLVAIVRCRSEASVLSPGASDSELFAKSYELVDPAASSAPTTPNNPEGNEP